MKILIATDKFKGSLSANEACKSILRGIERYNNSFEIALCPMADGGEGSLDIIEHNINAKKVFVSISNPIIQRIDAYYLLKNNTAYIELSKASGLELLVSRDRNPMHTTTIGTGELICDAIKKGAKEIFLFVGGSSTTDAGIGIAKALGYKFLDITKGELFPSGENMINVDSIDNSNLCFKKSKVKFTVLTDVENAMFGENGAAYVFARQKGASKDEIEYLDKGLQNVSKVIKKQFGIDISTVNGGGAAGGVGAGLYGILGAEIKSGVSFISKIVELEKQIQNADLVICGEGKLDNSSFEGKVVGEVFEIAKKHNKKCAIFVGQSELTDNQLKSVGVKYLKSIDKHASNIEDSIKNVAFYLEKIAFDFIEKMDL